MSTEVSLEVGRSRDQINGRNADGFFDQQQQIDVLGAQANGRRWRKSVIGSNGLNWRMQFSLQIKKPLGSTRRRVMRKGERESVHGHNSIQAAQPEPLLQHEIARPKLMFSKSNRMPVRRQPKRLPNPRIDRWPRLRHSRRVMAIQVCSLMCRFQVRCCCCRSVAGPGNEYCR